jgi:hypothetical protein
MLNIMTTINSNRLLLLVPEIPKTSASNVWISNKTHIQERSGLLVREERREEQKPSQSTLYLYIGGCPY